MGTAATDVAKALLDSLPNLDLKRLIEDARRQLGIVVVGDPVAAQLLLTLLTDAAATPSDSKLALWRHQKEQAAPLPLGKTELALVIPATDEYVRAAREQFGGVPIVGIKLPDTECVQDVYRIVDLSVLDRAQVGKRLVPVMVERLWDRRLALARGCPITRDRISRKMIERAAKDVRVLLGSVAGAGSGRSGAPTPATAQLLVHQALLIVAVGAVYGADLEDRRALIRRVVPSLTPTLILDVAESQISRLAREAGGDDKRRQLYGTAAAVVARPTLSASSTLLAGMAARKVFRVAEKRPRIRERLVSGVRSLGKRATENAGQGAAVISEVLAVRPRRRANHEVTAAGQDDEQLLNDQHDY